MPSHLSTFRPSYPSDYDEEMKDEDAGDEDYVPSGWRSPMNRGRRNTRSAPPPLSSLSPAPTSISTRAASRLCRRDEVRGPRQRKKNGSKASSCGSWAHLPTMALHNILERCCQDEGGVPAACAMAGVCRSWRDAVRWLPSVWRRVDLSFCRNAASDKLFWRQRERWSEALEVLVCSGCTGLSETGLLTVANHCRRMHTLDVSYCNQLHLKGFRRALTIMLTREETEDGSVQPLRKLKLSGIREKPLVNRLETLLFSIFRIQAENPRGPVLEHLSMKDCARLSLRPLYDISSQSVQDGRQLLSALTFLSFARSTPDCLSASNIDIVDLQYAAPNIEVFDLNFYGGGVGWTMLPGPRWTGRLWPEEHNAVGWPKLRAFGIGCIDHPAEEYGGCFADNDVLEQALSHSLVLEEVDLSNLHHQSHIPLPLFFLNFACPLRRFAFRNNDSICFHNDTAWMAFNGDFVVDEGDEDPPGANFLSNLPGLVDSLEELNAAKTSSFVTDESLEVLIMCRNLKYLNASFTNISVAGLKHFLRYFKGNKQELRLKLEGCRSLPREVRQAAYDNDMIKLLEVLSISTMDENN